MNKPLIDPDYPTCVGGEHTTFYTLVHDVSRLQRTLFDRALKPLQITRAQWWLLKTLALSESGSLNQTELATLMSSAKANTGKLIARMAPLALVKRSNNPSDRRSKYVEILTQGLSTLEKTRTIETRLASGVFKNIQQDEINTAAAVLEAAKINIFRKHIGTPSSKNMPGFIHKIETSAGHADPNWLGFLIHDVSRLRQQVIDQLLKPIGLTRSQWWVLNFLKKRDGMSQIDLAKELDISRSALGALVLKLEDNKLISKYPDPEDSRRNRIFLTKAGRNLTQSIKNTSAQAEDFVLSGVAESAIKSSTSTLKKMKESLFRLISTTE